MAKHRRPGSTSAPFNIKGTAREFPVQVYVPEDLSIQYADAFIVHHSDEEFVVSFMQLQYPIALTEEDYRKIRVVESLCFSRIALTPRRLEVLIDVLQQNLASYKEERGIQGSLLPKEKESEEKESE
jgi:hypothetical protein